MFHELSSGPMDIPEVFQGVLGAFQGTSRGISLADCLGFYGHSMGFPRVSGVLEAFRRVSGVFRGVPEGFKVVPGSFERSLERS